MRASPSLGARQDQGAAGFDFGASGFEKPAIQARITVRGEGRAMVDAANDATANILSDPREAAGTFRGNSP